MDFFHTSKISLPPKVCKISGNIAVKNAQKFAKAPKKQTLMKVWIWPGPFLVWKISTFFWRLPLMWRWSRIFKFRIFNFPLPFLLSELKSWHYLNVCWYPPTNPWLSNLTNEPTYSLDPVSTLVCSLFCQWTAYFMSYIESSTLDGPWVFIGMFAASLTKFNFWLRCWREAARCLMNKLRQLQLNYSI